MVLMLLLWIDFCACAAFPNITRVLCLIGGCYCNGMFHYGFLDEKQADTLRSLAKAHSTSRYVAESSALDWELVRRAMLCLKLFPSRSGSKTMRTTADRDGDWSVSFIPGLSFLLFVVEMIVELVCSAVALLLYMNTLSADFCYDDRYSPSPSLHPNS